MAAQRRNDGLLKAAAMPAADVGSRSAVN